MKLELPSIPLDDSDFTPELARKILTMYQEFLYYKDKQTTILMKAVETYATSDHGKVARDAMKELKELALEEMKNLANYETAAGETQH